MVGLEPEIVTDYTLRFSPDQRLTDRNALAQAQTATTPECCFYHVSLKGDPRATLIGFSDESTSKRILRIHCALNKLQGCTHKWQYGNKPIKLANYRGQTLPLEEEKIAFHSPAIIRQSSEDLDLHF